jgi:hypothetical protein
MRETHPRIGIRRGVVVVAVILLASVMFTGLARAAPDTDAAVKAMRTQIAEMFAGQYGLAWKALHPAQQALLPRDEFMHCAAANAEAASSVVFDDVEVLKTYREPVLIPGTDVHAKSVAITIRITAHSGLLKDEDVSTGHYIRVGKRWTWILRDPSEFCDLD